MLDFLISIFNYIGSAMPLCILCFMIVFIKNGKKIKKETIVSYVVVSVLMFFILYICIYILVNLFPLRHNANRLFS